MSRRKQKRALMQRMKREWSTPMWARIRPPVMADWAGELRGMLDRILWPATKAPDCIGSAA